LGRRKKRFEKQKTIGLIYKVVFKKSAQKSLEQLPKVVIKKVSEKIDNLSENPRPLGCKKLEGRDGYRIRIGDYRVLYEINDTTITVLVMDVANRKEIYKKK
jgi:mRNA interferase RelE/StbE